MALWLLNQGQKEQHVQVCQDILEQLEIEPNLLKRVVTGDKSWIFEYDRLTYQMEEHIATKIQKKDVKVQNQARDVDCFF